MGKGRLIFINVIGMIVVLCLIAAGGYVYYQNQNYVKTDDAVVSADMVQVMAPASGLLASWNGKEGNQVDQKQEVGSVVNGQQTVPVDTFAKGTIIKNEVNQNQMVQAGQVLAQTADLGKMYITANVDETAIKNIEVGNSVDISVDGDSGTVYNGKIQEIGYATNSVFSALPSGNSGGTFTKVTQKVPVKISIANPSTKVLPGMNAEVKISK